MTSLVVLYNKSNLLTNLLDETVLLIHHTKIVDAIKKLVNAHDIIELAIEIEKHNAKRDVYLYRDLNHIRCDLIRCHSNSFTPPALVVQYYSKMGHLFNILKTEGTNV